MKKHLLKLALATLSSFILSGCTLNYLDIDFDFGGESEEEAGEVEETNLIINSYLDHIEVEINDVGKLGTDYRLVALQPFEYLGNESTIGLALPENVGIKPIEIATVKGGEAQVISIPKTLDNGLDSSILKYYIFSKKNDILEGPIYVSKFNEHIFNYEPLKPVNKKGCVAEAGHEQDIIDFGSSYVSQNIYIEDLIVPNEIVTYDEDKKENIVVNLNWKETTLASNDPNGYIWIKSTSCPDEVDREEYVDKLVLNGKTYYFRMYKEEDYRSIKYEKSLDYYSELFSKFTNPDLTKDKDAVRSKIIANLLLKNSGDYYKNPYFLYYFDAYATSGLYQLSTNNERSFGYAQALFEYLAKRFMAAPDSQGKYTNGEVLQWVLGYEIDYDKYTNGIIPEKGQKLLTDNYVEEVERCLRLANNVFKKYHQDSTVSLSFSNCFVATQGSYSSKNILNVLCNKTIKEGNYDWGLSWHAYGVDATKPNYIRSDYTDYNVYGDYSSPFMTLTNFEVLDNFLHQPNKMCGDKVRKVFINNTGVSSVIDPDNPQKFNQGQREQCAGLIYGYLKICHLESVAAFTYFKISDYEEDETIYFGLIDGLGAKKMSYDVFRLIDTQYSDLVCADYLKEIEWYNPYNGISFGTVYGNITNWVDTMNVSDSGVDFGQIWDYKTNVANRTVSEDYSK